MSENEYMALPNLELPFVDKDFSNSEVKAAACVLLSHANSKPRLRLMVGDTETTFLEIMQIVSTIVQASVR